MNIINKVQFNNLNVNMDDKVQDFRIKTNIQSSQNLSIMPIPLVKKRNVEC